MSAPAKGGEVLAIVLAGSRGPADPVALAAGVSHKALAPVAGVAMLARVLGTLAAVPRVGRVLVMTERAELLAEHPDLSGFLADGAVSLLPAAGSPSLSVLAALDAAAEPFPCLVTTADHPLLTPAMVEHFLDRLPAGADAVAGLARAETIQGAHPGTRRTYLRFRDGAYSGCNLFALLAPPARDAVSFWSRVERDRKRPWRMVRHLGLGALLSFATGRLRLAAALDRLGGRTGSVLRVVDMPFADAAVDVDRPDDLRLAERILAGRRSPEVLAARGEA